MRKTETMLDVQQTIALLVAHLGSPVGWAAWLADIRRTPREGKKVPELHGHRLYPAGQSGAHQAMYRPAAVKKFIEDVLTEDPGIKKAHGPRKYVFEDFGPLQPWRFCKMRPAITPTTPATLLKRAA